MADFQRAMGRANICPTQRVLTVVNGENGGENGGRRPELLRWGLLPAWATVKKGPGFQARDDKVATSTAWKRYARSAGHRCLWSPTAGSSGSASRTPSRARPHFFTGSAGASRSRSRAYGPQSSPRTPRSRSGVRGHHDDRQPGRPLRPHPSWHPAEWRTPRAGAGPGWGSGRCGVPDRPASLGRPAAQSWSRRTRVVKTACVAPVMRVRQRPA